MIKEIKLSSLNNVIPKVNKKEPPRSINNDLTPFFFTSMFIGSKNSGKSYGLVKMIKNYEEQPVKDSKGNILEIRTILFCPTGNSEANPILILLSELNSLLFIELIFVLFVLFSVIRYLYFINHLVEHISND